MMVMMVLHVYTGVQGVHGRLTEAERLDCHRRYFFSCHASGQRKSSSDCLHVCLSVYLWLCPCGCIPLSVFLSICLSVFHLHMSVALNEKLNLHDIFFDNVLHPFGRQLLLCTFVSTSWHMHSVWMYEIAMHGCMYENTCMYMYIFIQGSMLSYTWSSKYIHCRKKSCQR